MTEPVRETQVLRIGDTVWTLVYEPYGARPRTVDMVTMREWSDGTVLWEYHLHPFSFSGPNSVRAGDMGEKWFQTEEHGQAAAAARKERFEREQREHLQREIEEAQARLAELSTN